MSAEGFDLESYVRRLAREEVLRVNEEGARVVAIDQPNVSTVEPLVGTRAAAAHLSISERQLRQLISERLVPFYKVGSSVRFKLSELESHARIEERRLKAV